MTVSAKICGITRPDDAALAAAHGAARLGVVFAWGPRVVDEHRAAEIVAAAAGVPVLGVVADRSADELLTLADRTGLAGFQLHAGTTAATAQALRDAGLEVWRVAILGANDAIADAVDEARRGADAVLVEPRVPGRPGGRGVALDPALAVRVRGHLSATPMVLAGGLTPGTVAGAIRLVGPDFVDVSSGVEASAGIKDPTAVIRFLEAVRDAGSAPRPDR